MARQQPQKKRAAKKRGTTQPRKRASQAVTLVPDKFVVTPIVRVRDAKGKLLGEQQLTPIPVFTEDGDLAERFMDFVRKFPAALKKFEAENNSGDAEATET